MPRRIVVDDASPRIQYGPGWAPADIAPLNKMGNYGPVFRGTTHRTAADGAQLRFAFAGTGVRVAGSIDVIKLANGTRDPTWACTVDGKAIGQQNPTFGFPENNWELCASAQGDLPPGEHTLEVTVHTAGRPFYLDGITYRPEEDADGPGAIVEYTNTDANVTFSGAGWRRWGAQNVTNASRAQVALDFYGTEVTMMGFIPIELAHSATSASYVIDGADPRPITLAGIAPGITVSQCNAVIFSAAGLAPAPHRLVLTYHGDAQHTPLPVGVFHVNAGSPAGGPAPSFTNTATGSTPSPLATSTSASPGRHAPNHTALIVGLVLGGLAILAIMIITGTALCLRRRRAELRALDPDPFASDSDRERWPVEKQHTKPQAALPLGPPIEPASRGRRHAPRPGPKAPPRAWGRLHQDSGGRLGYGGPRPVGPRDSDVPPMYTRHWSPLLIANSADWHK
ncbi:hypothetical protein MIND_01403200 [Mycena indigotica]|uniref:Uncharacterized protein n=1 Tax=Mycena indigotica TaxID=2126181 RepID=A0A8H6RX23_9AGAR|nr:uncharacterized protein MIND_01403200 [Mycena indigotica]KAF7288874.1 hypothetical protein MIND_01403200 [Mycena indigotica]